MATCSPSWISTNDDRHDGRGGNPAWQGGPCGWPLRRGAPSLHGSIGLDAGKPDGYLLAANEHLRAGKLKTALELANTGLPLASTPANRAFGLRIRAIALLRTSQPRAAADAVRDALSIEPLYPANHVLLAQTLWRRRRFGPAEATLKHALSLDPMCLNTLTVYARFLQALKRQAEASAMAEQAAAVAPDSMDVAVLRGEIAVASGRIEMAHDMALSVLSRDAENTEALELLAKVKARRNWLAKPFWWLQNLSLRGNPIRAFLLLFAVGLALAAVRSLVPPSLVALLPSETAVKLGLATLFLGSAVVSGIIFARVKYSSRKAVRLKRAF